MYNTRPAMLINVTKCIDLKTRTGGDQCLPEADFTAVQKWLRKDNKFAN